MFRRPYNSSRREPQRAGLSLVELLVASVVMTLLAGGIAALAVAVQSSSQSHYGRGLTLQHGRVAVERIQQTLQNAHVSDVFPGFVVFAETVHGISLPDTLVVWFPQGAAAAPQGGPRMNELVVFCADPSAPQRLLEIRVPLDQRPAPPLSDSQAWRSELTAMQRGEHAQRTELTDLLRVVQPPDGLQVEPRAAIRFEVRLRPAPDQWADYLQGNLSWSQLPWPQGIYGAQHGMRQAWCRFELQLRPADVDDHSRAAALPFLGSAAVYHLVQRQASS